MDARVPERALTDACLDGLSDAAYRIWVAGLVYAVGQSSDGRIPRRALRLLHPDGARLDLANELVECGVWKLDGDGWLNLRYQPDQTTATDVERLREQSRQRSAKYRESKAAGGKAKAGSEKDEGHAASRVTDDPWLNGEEVAAASLDERDASRDDERDVTRNRVGEARRGEERRGEALTGTQVIEQIACDSCGLSMNKAVAQRDGRTRHGRCEPSAQVGAA